MVEPVRLLGLLGAMEARILQGALTGAGIKSDVQLNFVTTADPPAPGYAAELWVSSEDFEAAQAVVAQAQAEDPDGAEQRCAGCGESAPATFAECWSCGQALQTDA